MGQQRGSRHDGAWQFEGLPLLLLISFIIHLALICFPYPGLASGRMNRNQDAASVPLLNASVSRAVPVAAAVREMPRKSQPEPARRAADPSISDGPDLTSAVDVPRGPVFYPANALTIRPHALGEPLLDAVDVISGEIVMSLSIDDQGTVVEVSVERSDLPAERLSAVTEAFRRLRFSPGEVNGQKVGALVRIAVSYDDERLLLAP